MAAVARFRELLYCPEALAAAKKMPQEVREPLEHALRLSRNKHRAALTLWDAAQHEEGFALAADALKASLEAAHSLAQYRLNPASPALPPYDSPAAWDETLELMRTLGARKRIIRALERARQATSLASEPPAQGDGPDAAMQAFEPVLVAHSHLDRVLTKAAASPAELSYRRWRLWLLMALFVLTLAFGVWKVSSLPWGLSATASSFYGNDPQHGPELVLDGSDSTEWLLPENATGWLEIRSQKPRDIKTLRILNGHNPGFDDRAVKDYRVEVFSQGNLALTVAGTFLFSPKPTWVSHPIGVKRVDRLRITVHSSHSRGGALAEIEVK